MTSALPRDWDELVVVVAGTWWDGMMSERHVAAELSRYLPVLWVDSPVSWLSPLLNRSVARGLRGRRLRRVAPSVVRLTPVTVPGFTRPVLRELALRQTRFAVRRAVRRLGRGRVRATVVACLDDMLGVVPAERTLLYGTDDWVAGAALMGLDVSWVAKATHRQLTTADAVVAVSPVLRDTWRPVRDDVLVIPNGCDTERFAGTDRARLPGDVHLPGPIAGFVGHLSDRIELAHLEAVAERGVSLLLVGARQPTFQLSRMQALLSRPNVQWVGHKPFEELPSYLRVMDVGLTPYADTEFNRASFPLKTLEYLAAGRGVVATDLPATRWLGTELVAVADSPARFADEVVAQLQVARQADLVARRVAFAQEHSWRRRGEEIARVLGLPAPARAG